MFGNLTTDQVAEMARQVGHKVAREFPGSGIEAEDISSEALTKLLENKPKNENPDYIYRVLERYGTEYANKERYDYILFSSQYVYTPREVRAILEHVYYDPNARDVPTEKDDWLSADIGKGTIGISIVDIDVAMEKIKPEYRKTLKRRFYLGDEIHRETVARAIDALTRSVNRLMYRKGHSGEGPGSRKAVSNREARHVTVAEGSFETPRETDALNTLQNERLQERSDPPGTHFNWNKYDN